MNKIQIHKQICEELNKMYEEKNKRYGDSFSKVRKELGDRVILVRLMDKLERLKTLLGKPELENEESVEDTLKDLANYAIMELVERQIDGAKWPGWSNSAIKEFTKGKGTEWD